MLFSPGDTIDLRFTLDNFFGPIWLEAVNAYFLQQRSICNTTNRTVLNSDGYGEANTDNKRTPCLHSSVCTRCRYYRNQRAASALFAEILLTANISVVYSDANGSAISLTN
jgi:hypothetical protein